MYLGKGLFKRVLVLKLDEMLAYLLMEQLSLGSNCSLFKQLLKNPGHIIKTIKAFQIVAEINLSDSANE